MAQTVEVYAMENRSHRIFVLFQRYLQRKVFLTGKGATMLSRLWIPGALAAAVVLIGCSESSTATAPPAVATATQPSGPPPTATVGASSGEGADVQANIQNFTHPELTVKVGDTVV